MVIFSQRRSVGISEPSTMYETNRKVGLHVFNDDGSYYIKI